jgi:GR25 family glycosyltransferase involved in LPS biosynthesis
MEEKNLEKIIILEDDARFNKNFKQILVNVVNQMQNQNMEWDLM